MSPIEGYLASKRSSCPLKSWKAHRYEVKDGVISYYWNKKPSIVKVIFVLTDDSTVEDLGSEGKNQNVILVMIGYEKSLKVSAPSPGMKRRWVAAIRDEIEAIKTNRAFSTHVAKRSAQVLSNGLSMHSNETVLVCNSWSFDTTSDISDLTQSEADFEDEQVISYIAQNNEEDKKKILTRDNDSSSSCMKTSKTTQKMDKEEVVQVVAAPDAPIVTGKNAIIVIAACYTFVAFFIGNCVFQAVPLGLQLSQ